MLCNVEINLHGTVYIGIRIIRVRHIGVLLFNNPALSTFSNCSPTGNAVQFESRLREFDDAPLRHRAPTPPQVRQFHPDVRNVEDVDGWVPSEGYQTTGCHHSGLRGFHVHGVITYAALWVEDGVRGRSVGNSVWRTLRKEFTVGKVCREISVVTSVWGTQFGGTQCVGTSIGNPRFGQTFMLGLELYSELL